MRKRIVRVSPIQAGKVLAVMYGAVSVPFVLIALVAIQFDSRSQPISWVYIVLMPLLYVIFGFIFTVIAAWVYNLIASWTGGLEFDFEDQPDT